MCNAPLILSKVQLNAPKHKLSLWKNETVFKDWTRRLEVIRTRIVLFIAVMDLKETFQSLAELICSIKKFYDTKNFTM